MINNTVVSTPPFARPRTAAGGGRGTALVRAWEDQCRCFASAFEYLPVAVAITDDDGRLQHANRSYLARAGRTLDELIGDNWDVLRDGHADEGSYQACREALRRQGTWEGLLASTKPGDQGCERVRIWPVRDADGEVTNYVCTRMDVTEVKQLQDELQQARKVESLGALAGGIAHDFNNVLAVINGYSELFQQTSDPFRQHRYVQQIRRAGDRATLLVRRILSFSRKHQPQLDAVDLNGVVVDLVSMLTETFPHIVEFKTALGDGLPWLCADASQIQQLLLNLCVNARDAMPAGGTITITTEMKTGSSLEHIGAELALTYVCLCVADTGVGMSPELRQRIFEPFFTTKHDRGGTGLGLSVVYSIVSAHHGLLDVRSALGKGSSFHIYLPASSKTQAPPPPGVDDAFPCGCESILVADDEPALRELLSVALKSKGYTVRCVGSGIEAIELITDPSMHIDAVLLDMDMPLATGMDVLRVIRVVRPALKVVVVTGSLSADGHAELEQLGQRTFVLKPFELAVIGRRLRDVLDGVSS